MSGNVNPSALSAVSLRCGIAGAALCWLPVANFALCIFAVVLAVKARKAVPEGKNKISSAGLILGITGLPLSFLMSLVLLGLLP